jgi:dienelactone hydrolase
VVPSARPPASRAGGVIFLLVFTLFVLLSATGYWSPLALLTGGRTAPLNATSEPVEIGPSLIEAASRAFTATQTVSIPPTFPPLQAVPLAGLPAVVTPASTGGAIAARPILARQPRMPSGPLPAVLRLPAGAGPFPAVILLHGCNGPFSGMPDWAYRLNAWGYAALMPDSMTPRGVKSVCDPAEQPKVTAWDRVGDIGAAATWLRTRSEIDPNRIAVLGLSHGGATAALAAQAPYAGMRLRAAVDYYGPCTDPRLHGSLPLLVLAGEADDWGDPAQRCRAYGQELRPDQLFEIHTYPGVVHAFDSGPRTRVIMMGHAMAYDRAAAEDSFTRVHTFLDRLVKD